MTRFILAFLLIAPLFVSAGNDSLQKRKPHSPRKASIMSACLPGLGQVYNKKYWKVPVIYAAMAVPAWFIYDNHNQYKSYKQAYIFRTDNDPGTVDEYPLFTESQLKENVDFYRRYRDMNIFIAGLVYALNIADAGVDAHLMTFDVSNNLSMSLAPTPHRAQLCFVLKF